MLVSQLQATIATFFTLFQGFKCMLASKSLKYIPEAVQNIEGDLQTQLVAHLGMSKIPDIKSVSSNKV